MASKCTKDKNGNLVVEFANETEALREIISRERNPAAFSGTFATLDGNRMIIHHNPFDRNGGQQVEQPEAGM